MNAASTNFMRNVNNALARNRRILTELNPNGKVKTKRDLLLQKGFDFEYHTHTYTTRAGDVYRFCYEQGYLILNHEFVLLVEREDEHSYQLA